MSALILTIAAGSIRMSASTAVGVRGLIPVTVSPAPAGASVLTITRLGSPAAQADLTDGSGTIDLSTPEAIAFFAGLPASSTLAFDASLWSSDLDRLVGQGRITVANSPDSGTASLRIAAAGELRMALAEAINAGTPVKRDASGKAAPVGDSEAHLFIGIARTGGDPDDEVAVVTAGLVAVTAWGLTPGLAYYLPHTAGDPLTSEAPAAHTVRLVGLAADASTLIIAPAPAVQQTLGTAPHYLTWDHASRLFLAVAPATSAVPYAIPALDAQGLIPAACIPSQSAAAIAAHRLQFAALSPLSDPTGPETVALINAMLSILKTGA